MHNKIKFEKIAKEHFPLIHKWFNKPHVQEFYSLRDWADVEVEKKLLPLISQEKPVFAYVVNIDHLPIAYVQYYRVANYSWPEQDLKQEIIDTAAGLDFFIGEEKWLGTGIAKQILEKFLATIIWKEFAFCIVDPDIRNMRSIKFFTKCKFALHKAINTHDALNREVELQLLIRKK